MDWLFLAEVSLAGIGAGGLYALTGLAFVLIYKATRVVNLAIGEILMLGGYVFFGFAAGLALPTWLAILLTLAVAGLFGGVVERLLIRPMLGESPISVFMLTIGLGSILVGVVELLWGANPLQLPDYMPNTPLFIGEAYVSAKVATAFAVAAVTVVAFLLLFRFWRGGVALRATAGDQAAAYSMGIDVPRVFSLAWVIACITAAASGMLVGAIGGISPTMGVFGLSVLVVVIVGGLDSVLGAMVAGLFIGLLEALTGAFLGGEFKMLATFTLLVAVLVVRPYGLFGTHEIERL
ncbi:branched-chain amino acid ABC transporter permease [Caenispirillum bisanense]|uniref:Amino acid/amide ABC transporter membrane protein 1, HAAT family n=1 Tax=Caenispirillum bisanense TaxID=414052 RepID=A0A286GL86_9PROT|nr:branched-chain amino acid ABC transporter permease [Caenispirillum bisanense]SOD96303.1 amino acid/amide ABC transporter membrane protein 1, HAAT family [Caenispirillum bisanense]